MSASTKQKSVSRLILSSSTHSPQTMTRPGLGRVMLKYQPRCALKLCKAGLFTYKF